MHGRIYTDGEFGGLQLSEDQNRSVEVEIQPVEHPDFQPAVRGREEEAQDCPFPGTGGGACNCRGTCRNYLDLCMVIFAPRWAQSTPSGMSGGSR